MRHDEKRPLQLLEEFMDADIDLERAKNSILDLYAAMGRPAGSDLELK